MLLRQPGFIEFFKEASQIQQFWGLPFSTSEADPDHLAAQWAAKMLLDPKSRALLIQNMADPQLTEEGLHPHFIERLIAAGPPFSL